MAVFSDIAGGKIMHSFYIPHNISWVKDGLKFKVKDWYDAKAYK